MASFIPKQESRVFIEPKQTYARSLWILVVLIFGIAAFLRVHEISNRPLHNDEGVNHFFLQQIDHNGYYPYSHENYHGPSYFYLTKSFTDLLGTNDLTLRLSAIICGLLLLALVLAKIRSEGFTFVILACGMLAISSSLVFYSRYAIHEMLFSLSGAALAFCLYDWAVNRSKLTIYLGGISLAILIATKETFIITLFCLGLAYLSLGKPKQRFKLFWEDRAHIAAALGITVVLIVAFFTGGFKWFEGIREMFLAVPQWLNRNEADYGHHKPFIYYIGMMLKAEPQLVVALILPLFFLLVKDLKFLKELRTKEALWIRFLNVWGFSALLVYSFVKYKTPWLIVNITFPLTLVSAWWLALLLRSPGKFQLLGKGLLILALIFGSWGTYKYVFEKPYGPGNPYSYVHTSPGFLEMLALIENYREKNPDSRILVGQTGYWPLPYYIRSYADKAAYLHTREPEKYVAEYDIIIVDHTVKWDHPDYAKRYFRLSDVGEAFIYLRR